MMTLTHHIELIFRFFAETERALFDIKFKLVHLLSKSIANFCSIFISRGVLMFMLFFSKLASPLTYVEHGLVDHG